MKPLNYAILKFFCSGKEACRKDIQNALRKEYGKFRAFKDKQMDDALQTACSNGLIEESRLELDADNNLIIYYKANPSGIDAINKYIPD